MAYNKQSHYKNAWNKAMAAKTRKDCDEAFEEFFNSYPEGKKDKEFVDKYAREVEKSFNIILEAAKDKTIKDLDWWNSKDRNLYELIYECFKLVEPYRPADGRKIVNEIFDTYGCDVAVCRSIRRHLVEGTPFIVEDDEQ
jgi:hypothetical protein